jgi:hypothetical protein
MGYQLRRLVLWNAKSKGWARMVVGEIADAIRDDEPTGVAWPGVDRLATILGVNRRSAIRAIEAAEAAGDLTITRHTGRPNVYKLSSALVSSCHQCQSDTSANLSPHQCQPVTTTSDKNAKTSANLSPEPQNHKRTTKEPVVVAGDESDTGPIPFSEPDSFTRKARAAGIGSQPSKRVSAAKDKAAAQFDIGALEDAPAIKVHRDVCGYVPMTPEQARKIVAGVNGDAETTWRANLNFWMAQGYRANNFDGQTERHATEGRRATARATQPAAPKVGQWQPAKGMYPQVPERTPEQMAEIHRQDLERTKARKAAVVDVIDYSTITEVPF